MPVTGAPARPGPQVLVLTHGKLGPPGLLGEWLGDRRFQVTVVQADAAARVPDPARFAFVASLGASYSPRDAGKPCVARELKLLETCLQRDVPVLGLCFGGQALATVLGGAVRRLEKPERGWHRIDTDAPGLVGEGPWLQWHYDAFTLPSGAEELARSAACPQAFTSGRNLGTQFHPEATAAIAGEWARQDPHHAGDPAQAVTALEEGRRRHGAQAREAARRLFDGFWQRCGGPLMPPETIRRLSRLPGQPGPGTGG
jgi:GMP synthase-like glutamine amidotransferase